MQCFTGQLTGDTIRTDGCPLKTLILLVYERFLNFTCSANNSVKLNQWVRHIWPYR